ncbi:PALP domain-containing protein [Caenorhabditis elegans]|uniref:PALP domain-containing protein n=1 Tax=Caenorhabditis elegans TaxID=6239 RepID=H2L2D2_CAEEL|nr:PALP domain-containing protein [Caenorhabditis elegans]CCE72319.1 PALP domain-containing protein [Caenorhabditis elegans]|eukprot:NP_001254875.1 Uncharacterized protein CELE_C54C6.11 [Caenorhabditis elegans]
MDCLPTYSTASKQESTFVVSSEIARILACDLSEAAVIWEDLKKSQNVLEVRKRLEEADVLYPSDGLHTVTRIFQLVQSQQISFTCMNL